MMMMMMQDIYLLSLHYNGDLLTLSTPSTPLSQSTNCLWFAPTDLDHDCVIRAKERATFGPELSGLPGDLDY
jgi:hypothetical protein